MKSPSTVNRDKVVAVRLSAARFRALRGLAESSGLPVSLYAYLVLQQHLEDKGELAEGSTKHLDLI